MKRLHYFNLLGVVVLILLCVTQWQRDRRLNLEVNRLDKTRLEQALKLVEQEQNIRGLNDDLTQFKDQFTKAQSELADALQKLHVAERLTNQLAGEREQLKASITNWVAAVNSRDERIKEAIGEVRRLGTDLNTSIRKYNELATNHNALVKDLNDLRTRLTQPQPGNPAQQPEPARKQ